MANLDNNVKETITYKEPATMQDQEEKIYEDYEKAIEDIEAVEDDAEWLEIG